MFVNDEIGSEYWLADTAPGIRNVIDGAVYTASGRAAQSLVIKSAAFAEKTVLLPAYTCQHIVEPFAWHGWAVDFYDIDTDLSVNRASLEKGLEKKPGCLVLQSYYGFPTISGILDLAMNAQNNGVVVIEDITHSFAGCGHIYPSADYFFCSLRKWSGLSDGGFALASQGSPPLEEPEVPMRAFAKHRSHAQAFKARYMRSGNMELKEWYLYIYNQAEELLDHDIGIYRMSNSAFADYEHLDFRFIAKRRQENYRYLLNHVVSEYIRPIFRDLPENAVPMMMPVYIPGFRTRVIDILKNNRIYCPVHWPMPVQLPQDVVIRNGWIYDSIMSIPCDQRYSADDLKRLVDVVNHIDFNHNTHVANR